jgi:hypothetical protein
MARKRSSASIAASEPTYAMQRRRSRDDGWVVSWIGRVVSSLLKAKMHEVALLHLDVVEALSRSQRMWTAVQGIRAQVFEELGRDDEFVACWRRMALRSSAQPRDRSLALRVLAERAARRGDRADAYRMASSAFRLTADDPIEDPLWISRLLLRTAPRGRATRLRVGRRIEQATRDFRRRWRLPPATEGVTTETLLDDLEEEMINRGMLSPLGRRSRR